MFAKKFTEKIFWPWNGIQHFKIFYQFFFKKMLFFSLNFRNFYSVAREPPIGFASLLLHSFYGQQKSFRLFNFAIVWNFLNKACNLNFSIVFKFFDFFCHSLSLTIFTGQQKFL